MDPILKEMFGLSRSLVKEAGKVGLTIGTVESCTGGLIGAAITSTPGSSAVFMGGLMTYSNDLKTRLAAVDPALLAEHGAVSEPVARAMAAGGREKLGTDLVISVTGIAGPGGGSPEKPVGTVWFGLASAKGIRAEKHLFDDLSRNRVRDYSVMTALRLLSQAVGEV